MDGGVGAQVFTEHSRALMEPGRKVEPAVAASKFRSAKVDLQIDSGAPEAPEPPKPFDQQLSRVPRFMECCYKRVPKSFDFWIFGFRKMSLRTFWSFGFLDFWICGFLDYWTKSK